MYLPEGDQANQAVQAALNRLTQSLDARKSRLFDPTLLAMAEGFLAPTKTGGFGESLGLAAGRVRQAEEQEAKREQEMAQAQLGIAEKGLELARQKEREKQYRMLLGGPEQAAPSAPGGQGKEVDVLAAAASDVPPGYEKSQSFQVAPANPSLKNIGQLLNLRMIEGKMSPADALSEAYKLNNDRYIFRDNAVYDKASGKVFFVATGNTTEVSTSKGPMKVPVEVVRMSTTLGDPKIIEQYVASLPSQADLSGASTRAQELAKRGVTTETAKRYIPAIQGEADLPQELAARFDAAAAQFGPNSLQAMAVVGKYLGIQTAEPSGVPSVQERERQAAVEKLKAEDQAKYENEQRREILNRSDDATQNMSRAAVFRQLADAPDASDMFGILSNNEVFSAIMRLVEQGVGATTPGGRVAIGVPDIQRVLRNLNLTPAQQARYQTAIGLMVEAQIKMAQYTKGAVSNYEQQLFAQAGINPEDTPASIRMKADMITLRGQFDKDVARAFEDSKMPIRDFKRSGWYQDRLKRYDEDLLKIAEGNRIKTTPRIPTWNPKTKSWE